MVGCTNRFFLRSSSSTISDFTVSRKDLLNLGDFNSYLELTNAVSDFRRILAENNVVQHVTKTNPQGWPHAGLVHQSQWELSCL